MAKLLSFKDMMPDGMDIYKDELTSYRRRKMKRTCEESEPTDEALTIQQRLARGRMLKRMKNKIKLGRERAKRRIADKGRLEKRAQKAARKVILKKILKGQDKSDLPFARRQELEKRLDKPAVKKRIKALARRMFKDIRRKEMERKRG